MPTINRTTSGMIGPSASEIQARVDALRSRFTAGNVIQASDFNELISMFKQFNDHYHQQTIDYMFEAYGNTAPTGSFYDSTPKNSGAMIDTRGNLGSESDGAPVNVSAGEIIAAGFHESLRAMFNAANGHFHQIEDRIY